MIDIIRLLLDFGVSLLLLFIIFVISPCFQEIQGEQLKKLSLKLHDKMLIFLAPIYSAQLCVVGIQLYSEQNPYTIGSMVLIVMSWLTGLAFLVPLLRKIESGEDISQQNKKTLYNRGWFRIAITLIMFLWSTLEVLILRT
jgi:hypothetical protein